MNLLLPILIGAVVLIASQSKTENKPSSKKDDDSGANPTKPSSSFTGVGGLQTLKCTMYQFYDSKNKKCVSFWEPGKTDEQVKQELINEAKKFYNKPDLGKAYIDQLCQSKIQNDEFIPNELQIKISKNVILKLWPMIDPSNLPPKKGHPAWLWTIWTNVLRTYEKVICLAE